MRNIKYLVVVGFFVVYGAQAEATIALQETYLTTSDGLSLYTAFIPAAAQSERYTSSGVKKPTILCVHGAFLHSRSFHDPIEYFVQQGFDCIVCDMRGHGKSGGERLYINDFEEYVADLEQICAHYKKRGVDSLVCVTYSVGAIVVLRYIKRCQQMHNLKALFFISPLFGIHSLLMPKLVMQGILLTEKYAPHAHVLTPPSFTDAWLATHDKALLQELKNDTLRISYVTIRALAKTIEAMESSFECVSALDIPVHFFIAGQDRVADNKRSKTFYDALPPANRGSWSVYKKAYHGLLHEVNRQQVYEDLLAILRLY